MSRRIDIDTLTTTLICEPVDAEGHRCAECGDKPETLLRFFTTRGNSYRREHDGLFCSKDCHDRWHGLKAR